MISLVSIVIPCKRDVCLNGGTCSDWVEQGVSKFKYSFPTGYYGTTCEVTPCTYVQCGNGGEYSNDGATYKCNCQPGFLGKFCENTSCTGEKCLNNGVCTIDTSVDVTTSSSYKCTCPTGFSGANCEITPCSTRPCQNNGQCVVEDGDYKCHNCYTGKDCEISPCTNNPCQNNGMCNIAIVNNVAVAKCICVSGYSGLFCDVTTCLPTNPCENGGTCLVIDCENTCRFECSCTEAFDGQKCEQKSWTQCDIGAFRSSTRLTLPPGCSRPSCHNDVLCADDAQ